MGKLGFYVVWPCMRYLLRSKCHLWLPRGFALHLRDLVALRTYLPEKSCIVLANRMRSFIRLHVCRRPATYMYLPNWPPQSAALASRGLTVVISNREKPDRGRARFETAASLCYYQADHTHGTLVLVMSL